MEVQSDVHDELQDLKNLHLGLHCHQTVLLLGQFLEQEYVHVHLHVYMLYEIFR